MEPGTINHKYSNRVLFAQLMFEFIGTGFLTWAYNFSTPDPNLGRAFAYFICWILAVTVSGAHFNPAVSLAVYLVERKYARDAGYLILVILC